MKKSNLFKKIKDSIERENLHRLIVLENKNSIISSKSSGLSVKEISSLNDLSRGRAVKESTLYANDSCRESREVLSECICTKLD